MSTTSSEPRQHTTNGNGSGAALHALGEAVIVRSDEVAGRMVTEILATDEAYRDLVPIDDLRESCRVNAVQLLIRTCRGELAPSAYRVAVDRIGARRVEQGLPLDSLLHAYRIGARLVWEALVVEADGDPAALSELASFGSLLWEIHDGSSRRIAESYQSAQQAIARCESERRHDHVDQLLDRRGGIGAQPVRAASALGLCRGVNSVVVALEVPGPAERHDHEPLLNSLEEALRGRGLTSAWRPQDHGGIGIVQFGGLSPTDVPWALLAGEYARVGISHKTSALNALPEARRMAETVLVTLPPGGGVAVLEDCLPDALLASAPDVGAVLVDAVLSGVRDLPAEDSSDMLALIEAFMTGDGSLADTAKRMHYHRNTIPKRLRRLREVSGLDLTRPGDATVLWLAVRALRLSTHSPGVGVVHTNTAERGPQRTQNRR